MIKKLQKLTFAIAVVLWIAVILVIAIAINRHQFWQITPFIAHNKPQNFVGWLITIAFICTVVSPILRLVSDK